VNSTSAFHLGLFGNRSLVAPDGVRLTGQAVQRHRIALLALLALSPDGALGREKLLGYLWPERESEHARLLLNQAVYNLRKALGDEAILSDGDGLRLNLELVRADVAEFDDAMRRGDHAAAVRLYGGPFLDGFSLGEAPEFDWWADRERQRLASAHARGLEALAEAAAQAGDMPRAVEWWKARAAQDPYDSRVTMRLMEALAASGNRAGALQQAGVHERLLQTEFSAAPSPDVMALAERLRSAPLEMEAPHHPEDAERPKDPLVAAETARAPNEPARPATVPPSSRARALRYGIAALTLAVAGVVALLVRNARHDALAAAVRQPSIAVLPLANLSADPHDAFLADGMTEELIGTLAKRGGLRVIASTSVFALRDRHLDVRHIADSLHVAQVLEGDVQKSGSRLRVRVRLVDARDGATLWSEVYERELRDIFAVEDDIASVVVRELGGRIGGLTRARDERHQTRNVAAYELYLRGNDPVLLRSDSGVRIALGDFQQAITLDASYAAAYAGLARMYLRQGLTGDAIGARHDRVLLAGQTATKALALDDSLADTHAAFALVQVARFELGSAESHLKRAADLEPGRSVFHEWLVRLYVFADRPTEALREAQRALELDPLSPTANAELARALLANGRSDDALAQLERVAALRPPLLRASVIAAQCYIKKGMWPQAIAAVRAQADRGGTMALAHLGYAMARSGQRDSAVAIRSTLAEQSRQDGGGALGVALVSAGLGDRDEAFAWLDRAISSGAMNIDGAELLFDELRNDPRFERVRERQGFQKR
jgi:TolB-like protein/DNA-binding SARP family transcriptional activator